MRFQWHVSLLAVGLVAGLGLGCEDPPKARDAAAQSLPQVAELTLRLDAPNDGAPSVSALAYRASVSGIEDVRSVVDPLMAPAPALDTGCLLRDVAGPARALGVRGGTVELDALSTLTVDLGSGQPHLRLAPRVYPDLASVVGGVVSEANPVALTTVPPALAVVDPANRRELVEVPELPRLLDADATPLPASASFPARSDLVLGVTGDRPAFVELRPFGATWALACTVGADRRVVVGAADLGRLIQRSGQVPVSVEAVARDARWLSIGGGAVRLTLEVRSSSVIELRP